MLYNTTIECINEPVKINVVLRRYTAVRKQPFSNGSMAFIIGKVHVAADSPAAVDALYFCFVPSSNTNNTNEFSLPDIFHPLFFGMGAILKTEEESSVSKCPKRGPCLKLCSQNMFEAATTNLALCLSPCLCIFVS